MSSTYIYDPIVTTFNNQPQVTVDHNFGREVGIEVYVGDEIVSPEIQKIDDNSFTVSFYEKGVLTPKTGRIIAQ